VEIARNLPNSPAESDILDKIARDVRRTVDAGYYRVPDQPTHTPVSLRAAILQHPQTPIIAEVKFASPSHGTIRSAENPEQIARQMVAGGAAALSVLAEPTHFGGHLENLRAVRKAVQAPVLMKDFVLSSEQLHAARALGADAILFIVALFDRHYCEGELPAMVKQAHTLGLEVLVEAYTEQEFRTALNSDADLLGINNRDLRSMAVDLGNTERILQRVNARGRLVVSESGIETPADIARLRATGAHAFLIGASIMRAPNIAEAVQRLVSGS
jgi:indole-3-glycerol phosphate synthase